MEIVLVVVLGIALAVLSAVLVKRWDKRNRSRYPERGSHKFFEMNREKRG